MCGGRSGFERVDHAQNHRARRENRKPALAPRSRTRYLMRKLANRRNAQSLGLNQPWGAKAALIDLSTSIRCARRGVRVRRPTRPAGLGLHSSEQPRSPGSGRRPGLGCTLREKRPLSNSGGTGWAILLPSAGEAETVVSVTVRRGVPVTVRRADVRRLIVERPAPQETRVWSPPAGSALYETVLSSSDRYWRGMHVQSNS